MTAILTSLFISLGLAPAAAKTDPCFMPAWVTGESAAFACDFHDAVAIERTGSRSTYTGTRTGAAFTIASVAGKPDIAFIASDRVVPVNNAPSEAAMVGAFGGWVDAGGRVHGAYDAWTIQISATTFSSKPAGTLVALVFRSAQP